MTFEQIKELIDIVIRKGLHELEVERSDFRIRITGSSGVVHQIVQPGAPVVAAAEPPGGSAVSAGPVELVGGAKEDGHVITSPIVGTFYGAPSSDSDPYIQVGDRVGKGQVLCIVEAMKLMNEIESDVDGEVVDIMVSNAQPVEFGEPLFAIRVDS